MLLVIIAFMTLLFTGMPVAFAIGIAGALFFPQHLELPLTIPVQLTVTQTQNFALLAIPMFIAAGNLMNETGITDRLLKLASVLTGHMRGGLAQVVVVLELLLGGVTGSCIADASMQARMLGPEMIKRGYGKGFISAIIANASLITIMIPPGIGVILYGTVGNISIGRLFAAGIIPGLMMTVTLMMAVSYFAKKRGYLPEREKRASAGEIFKASLSGIWALLFPVMLLVCLRFGIFTPSEVGSFAAVYAIAVGLLAYRELTWQNFKRALEGSVVDTGGVMFLIALSAIFSYGIVWERLPEVISNFMLGISSSPTVILLVIIAVLLVAGMFVDGAVLILMLTPIFLPVALKLGLDPVHFGIIFVLAITIGNVTPPVGSAMYAVCTILDVSVEEFIRDAILFILAIAVVNVLIIWLPQTVLWLPDLIFGK
ncbi:TRAP transporter large permease [Moorella sulfitireducens]|uniref:TRAP transporter large permease n=1 Tax=Neomoorella sulfitireducens TaxID=2972948 RepID=UPI0021AD339D|nr:TRAP transporter large permease subunit [Moorella sulfitireducens]